MVAELLKARGLDYKSALPELERRVKLVGLDVDILKRYPIELSGGMKQRVVMVISTLLNPSLLIADEITSALDVSTQRARRRDAARVPRSELREDDDGDHTRPVHPGPGRGHDPRHVRGQARREGESGRGHQTTRCTLTPSCSSPRSRTWGYATTSTRSSASRGVLPRSSIPRSVAGSATAARSLSTAVRTSRRSCRSSLVIRWRAGCTRAASRRREASSRAGTRQCYQGLQDRHLRRWDTAGGARRQLRDPPRRGDLPDRRERQWEVHARQDDPAAHTRHFGHDHLRGHGHRYFERQAAPEYYRRVQGVFQDPFSSYNPVYRADRVFATIRHSYFPGVSTDEWRKRVDEVLESSASTPRTCATSSPISFRAGSSSGSSSHGRCSWTSNSSSRTRS